MYKIVLGCFLAALGASQAYAQAQVQPMVQTGTGPTTRCAVGGSNGTGCPMPVIVQGGSGDTVTSNQGTPNAGGVLGWFIQLLDGAGNAITSTSNALDVNIKSSSLTNQAINNAQNNGHTFLEGGANGGTGVGGLGAQGASVAGNPVRVGCRGASATPTAVTDGQLVDPECGLEGKVITLPYSLKETAVRGYATATNNSATSIIASAGGSLKNYITAVQCYNTSATTITVAFSDSASTAIIAPAGGGNNVTFPTPLATAAATAFTFTASSGQTTIGCAAQGFTGL